MPADGAGERPDEAILRTLERDLAGAYVKCTARLGGREQKAQEQREGGIPVDKVTTTRHALFLRLVTPNLKSTAEKRCLHTPFCADACHPSTDQSVVEVWHTKCADKTPIRMRHAEKPHLPLQATVKPRILDRVRGVLRAKLRYASVRPAGS